MTLDLQTLRQFVSLGERAKADGIPMSDIRRQEETILRALRMLDEQPGIVLADEVGMGKTFEALGVAAAFQQRRRRSRIAVLTPGPDLNTKWVNEFCKFPCNLWDGKESVVEARSLREFVDAAKTSQFLVAPVSMFQSGHGVDELAYLLSLYCYWSELHGNTANALISRALGPKAYRVDVFDTLFLDTFELGEVECFFGRAFRKLHRIYSEEGLPAFDSKKRIRRVLTLARSEIAGRLLPVFDLLIVDEAHKLKNSTSLRSQAMHTVFRKRFRKALFLTATPFQLDIRELKEVFAVFAQAKGAPSDLMDQIDELLENIQDYQTQYDDFQRAWSALDGDYVEQFNAAYDHSRDKADALDDPTSKRLLAQIDKLRELKSSKIEPGFRQWMIRSLREEKRDYRSHLPSVLPTNDRGCLPFLIYERFVAELFRKKHRTHKAAAEINMVSSYAAARDGAIIDKQDALPERADEYRRLLRRLLSQFSAGAEGDHPKLKHVLDDAIEAADHGEKTLVFCSRTATLRQLSKELDAVWRTRILQKWSKVFPDADEDSIFGNRSIDEGQKGRHAVLQSRFHRPQDALYLALREPYLRTVHPIADWTLDNLDVVISKANALLADLWVGKTSSERIDYQITKRCVEQAAAVLWRKSHANESTASDGLRRLCSPEFLTLGIDLQTDEHEADTHGYFQPEWQITAHTAATVIGMPGSIWESLKPELDCRSYELRVRVVEQLSRYLTFVQVPFVVDLLHTAKSADIEVSTIRSEQFLRFLTDFWISDVGVGYQVKLRGFLRYFNSRDPQQQQDILDGPLRTGDFARHTESSKNREKLREAFNTPLFPMVLIANEVMQEGLDLHKHCRRVVHHDLVWNPAQVEQRIGRIDRLGSLTSHLRETDPTEMLQVLYPVISGTIDQRLYRVVKGREKWLEFLLGAAPDFSHYSLDDEEPPPLPDRLSRELAIDLSPAS